MKNGTQSKNLTLVDSEDVFADAPPAAPHGEHRAGRSAGRGPSTALIFVFVCVACATAAVAAGSYAVWLTYRREAGGSLTDVRQILKSCQDRIVQMEQDLDQLPADRPHNVA